MNGWYFVRVRFFPLDPPLIPAGWHDEAGSLVSVGTQAVSVAWNAYDDDCSIFLALLVDLCRGLSFTVPPDNTTIQGNTIALQWSATLSDFNTTNPTLSFAALLILPPADEYHCPRTNIITQLGADVDGVIVDKTIASSTSKQDNRLSGTVLLRPKNSQNLTQPLSGGRDNLDLKDLESLSLINESPAFLVKQKAGSTTNTSTSSSSIPTASDNSPPTPQREGTQSTNLALIVGLSTALASLFSILVTTAIFMWRRRKRSQRRIRSISTIEEALTRPASLTPYPAPGEISVAEPRQKGVERRLNDPDTGIPIDVETRKERRVVVNDEDGGLRLLASPTSTHHGSMSVEQMPPSYSEANFR
ncbi:hypothetical protein PQX77_013273 [Marasmius sp. AFHP31]|nr:hypothetical protein PQX77_013273 [Marasmius sp. AFHP31]